ncbi:MAG: SDR family oxidoreductase [Chitinophagaceae bacterium]|nr:SDR family oxidoreductase [Chitinophagaceae bacterium]
MASNWALITGASSGIGLEMARIHAARGGNLVLVARRSDALEQIKTELSGTYPKIQVNCIVQDLAQADAALMVWEKTKALGIRIDLLVNNAGFGDFGYFHRLDAKRMSSMIHLNILALTELCRYYLPDMVERKSGGILNVASTAAFQPGPGMSVYFATKAYVLSFSEGLYEEVKDFGVRISALCPGPTGTQFFDAANMSGTRLTRLMPMPSAKAVAELGYNSLMSGKAVSIHGMSNRFLVFLLRFTPRSIVRRLSKKIIGVDIH